MPFDGVRTGSVDLTITEGTAPNWCDDRSRVTRASREWRRAARWDRRSSAGPRRLTWRGVTVSIAVAGLFLAFATFISLVAPVHVLALQRDGTRSVRADIRQNLWLVIPFRTQTLQDVTGVSTRRYQADASLPRRPADPVRPENEGFLILTGTHGSLEISMSPQNVYDIERRVNEFLAGSESRIRLWAVSNWKVAVIVQAVVLLPAALMLISLVWDIGAATRRSR